MARNRAINPAASIHVHQNHGRMRNRAPLRARGSHVIIASLRHRWTDRAECSENFYMKNMRDVGNFKAISCFVIRYITLKYISHI